MNAPNKDFLRNWATTTWSKILLGRGEGDEAAQARHQLLIRYHEVVYQYFERKLGPKRVDVAHELYSNFALRLLESDSLIKGANPERGRFRNYLMTALRNMINDYFRKLAGQPAPLPDNFAEAGPAEEKEDPDFQPLFAQELLNQAWKALEEACRDGQLHYTVLRFHSDHPEMQGPRVAEELSRKLGMVLSHDNVRQTLKRGRDLFARLLLQEVERSLGRPTPDELEQELVDLNLLSYCKRALEQRGDAGK
jgi:RNA polymerase sigma factor (sigma-70 family)